MCLWCRYEDKRLWIAHFIVQLAKNEKRDKFLTDGLELRMHAEQMRTFLEEGCINADQFEALNSKPLEQIETYLEQGLLTPKQFNTMSGGFKK